MMVLSYYADIPHFYLWMQTRLHLVEKQVID